MFKRLKRILVESYIGTIALGILVLDFVNIFVAPVSGWVSQGELAALRLGGLHPAQRPNALPIHDALPPLLRFILQLLLWCVLFVWLYSKPLTDSAPASQPAAEPGSH